MGLLWWLAEPVLVIGDSGCWKVWFEAVQRCLVCVPLVLSDHRLWGRFLFCKPRVKHFFLSSLSSDKSWSLPSGFISAMTHQIMRAEHLKLCWLSSGWVSKCLAYYWVRYAHLSPCPFPKNSGPEAEVPARMRNEFLCCWLSAYTSHSSLLYEWLFSGDLAMELNETTYISDLALAISAVQLVQVTYSSWVSVS